MFLLVPCRISDLFVFVLWLQFWLQLGLWVFASWDYLIYLYWNNLEDSGWILLVSGKWKYSVKPGNVTCIVWKNIVYEQSTQLVPMVCDHCFLASPVNSLSHPALPLNCSSSWCKAAPLIPSFCLCLRKVATAPYWAFPSGAMILPWTPYPMSSAEARAVAAGFGKVPCARLLARAWDRPGARMRTTSISHVCQQCHSSSAACKAPWVFLPFPLSPCHDTFFSVLRQQVSQNSPFCF